MSEKCSTDPPGEGVSLGGNYGVKREITIERVRTHVKIAVRVSGRARRIYSLARYNE